MSEALYPNYHSLTHKFIQLGDCWLNLDEVKFVKYISNEEKSVHGFIFFLKDNSEIHCTVPDIAAYMDAKTALSNILPVVRNPSIPYDGQMAPLLHSIVRHKSEDAPELPKAEAPAEESVGG